MVKIGASRLVVGGVLSLEIGLVVVASLVLAGFLTAVSAVSAPELLRSMILA